MKGLNNVNREDLLNKVRQCTPDLGFDKKYPRLFGIYGITAGGLYDGFYWFDDKLTDYGRKCGCKPLTEATDAELLEMWAITQDYWLGEYTEWLKRSEEKSSKLDHFIDDCERMYFGYDEDGYTDKTIDRVFNSIKEILNEHINHKYHK